MSKAYKDMTISELFMEQQRLTYYLNSKSPNYIGYKQNKASLKRVNDLIRKKASYGTR